MPELTSVFSAIGSSSYFITQLNRCREVMSGKYYDVNSRSDSSSMWEKKNIEMDQEVSSSSGNGWEVTQVMSHDATWGQLLSPACCM